MIHLLNVINFVLKNIQYCSKIQYVLFLYNNKKSYSDALNPSKLTDFKKIYILFKSLLFQRNIMLH